MISVLNLFCPIIYLSLVSICKARHLPFLSSSLAPPGTSPEQQRARPRGERTHTFSVMNPGGPHSSGFYPFPKWVTGFYFLIFTLTSKCDILQTTTRIELILFALVSFFKTLYFSTILRGSGGTLFYCILIAWEGYWHIDLNLLDASLRQQPWRISLVSNQTAKARNQFFLC